MIINSKSNISIVNNNYKDIFGAYLLEKVKYDTTNEFDIPLINSNVEISLPKALISYTKLGNGIHKNGTYVHFYLEDYEFDGKYGLWNALIQNRSFKKGFNFEKLNEVDGIILPDYSLYNDMPTAMQIWNTFRSRTVGCFFQRLGYSVIPNVRWSDERSYRYCFLGIPKGSIISVGSLGCLRNKQDHKLFIKGLIELIIRIKPKSIIIYGTLSDDMVEILERYVQNYVHFEAQISEAMVMKYGNEG